MIVEKASMSDVHCTDRFLDHSAQRVGQRVGTQRSFQVAARPNWKNAKSDTSTVGMRHDSVYDFMVCTIAAE